MKASLIFVILAIAAVSAQKKEDKPDCLKIHRETPKDISTYYHPHENDCRKYYQCSDAGLVEMECPEDLHFDRNDYVCGWPHEVEC